MTDTQLMSAIMLADKLKAMALESIAGIASRIKPNSLSFISRTLAGGEGIPMDADFETINFRLVRLAIRMPQHFYRDTFDDHD